MGVGSQISESEYLHTAYQPDCEYADGAIIERNVGTQDHSRLQAALTAYLFNRRKRWDIHVYPEQRVRVGPRRYLIPDLCVVTGERPAEQVLTSPPLIWIEILSPEDRTIRINQKVREVLDFGVPYVWVIDPQTLESELHTMSGGRTLEDGVLRIEGTGIEVPLGLLEED
ncbi:MAG: Uma2 family endonuclease [Acidobacteriia bacterium]|nr:Uma2 family endonuclease [Terriglobia bacterium]